MEARLYHLSEDHQGSGFSVKLIHLETVAPKSRDSCFMNDRLLSVAMGAASHAPARQALSTRSPELPSSLILLTVVLLSFMGLPVVPLITVPGAGVVSALMLSVPAALALFASVALPGIVGPGSVLPHL